MKLTTVKEEDPAIQEIRGNIESNVGQKVIPAFSAASNGQFFLKKATNAAS